ncbi:hypothetical protein Droror1_Dr00024803 [Drosera rotundifolia]
MGAVVGGDGVGGLTTQEKRRWPVRGAMVAAGEEKELGAVVNSVKGKEPSGITVFRWDNNLNWVLVLLPSSRSPSASLSSISPSFPTSIAQFWSDLKAGLGTVIFVFLGLLVYWYFCGCPVESEFGSMDSKCEEEVWGVVGVRLRRRRGDEAAVVAVRTGGSLKHIELPL